MSRIGADATGTSVLQLQALGATFVSRYVSDFPAKNLTLPESQGLSAAGIDLVTNWENDVDDWATGHGASYAQRAAAQHAACGGPSWAPIYFSVDEQVDPNDPVLHQYFRDINSVLGVARTGAYAQTSALRVLRSLGLIRYTWRSMSTFGLPEGLGNPGEFDVEQTGQFNADYDRDVANSTNFGQWRIGALAPLSTPKEIDMLIHMITGSPEVWAMSGSLYWHVADPTSLNSYKAAGVPVATITLAEHAAILAQTQAPEAVELVSVASGPAIQIDASGITAAVAAGVVQALTNPGFLASQGAAIAHAEAVETHNDTPAA